MATIIKSSGGKDISKGLSATSNDILLGKTAAVNGEIITGTIEPIEGKLSGTAGFRDTQLRGNSRQTKDVFLTSDFRDCVITSSLGDATAADVRTGKTFTSANGLNKTGTFVPVNDYIYATNDNGITVSRPDNNTLKIICDYPIKELINLYGWNDKFCLVKDHNNAYYTLHGGGSDPYAYTYGVAQGINENTITFTFTAATSSYAPPLSSFTNPEIHLIYTTT